MTALLIDTSSVFFRAHHALPPLTTSSGEHTAALYGFSSLLLKLLREEAPTSVAFARDLPTPTFRHERFAEYKAGRPPVPDALRTQWKHLDALIAAFGVPSHALAGFEADDALATLNLNLTNSAENVLIVSGDRDLMQVVGPLTTLLFIGARGQKPEKIDAEKIMARYGIAPAQMPMWLALVGEAADNLAGVAGIGAKTASKLVAQFGSAENLIAHLDVVMPPKTRTALEAAKERLLLNENLATLRTDLNLSAPWALPVTPVALANVREVFDALELKSLVKRLDALKNRRIVPKVDQLRLF
ncbi:MAG: 5'-3' exonuclease H3TH domain-containing protein [Polyangiaceae bacterium]